MTTKRILPVLSALMDDLDAIAAGAKPHPKASQEGDRRVLGIARKELTAAAAALRAAKRHHSHANVAYDPVDESRHCPICRALASLDQLTQRTP